MDERTTRGLPIAVIYGAAALLAVAVLPLPYGYYQLLRLVATVVFAWAAFVAFQRGRAGYGFGFAVACVALQPGAAGVPVESALGAH